MGTASAASTVPKAAGQGPEASFVGQPGVAGTSHGTRSAT